MLTDQKKLERAGISQYNLDKFNRNSKEFLRRSITIDEAWIYHYIPETKEQSKQ